MGPADGGFCITPIRSCLVESYQRDYVDNTDRSRNPKWLFGMVVLEHLNPDNPRKNPRSLCCSIHYPDLVFSPGLRGLDEGIGFTQSFCGQSHLSPLTP